MTTLELYNQVTELLANGAFDYEAATIKLGLATSAYTFDAAHDEWADVSASELSDASYTAGGTALAGKTVARSGTLTTFDANDVTFASLSGTFRHGVLYAVGSFGGKTNPLIGRVLFDDTPADVTVASIDFNVVWNSSGIFTVDLV